MDESFCQLLSTICSVGYLWNRAVQVRNAFISHCLSLFIGENRQSKTRGGTECSRQLRCEAIQCGKWATDYGPPTYAGKGTFFSSSVKPLFNFNGVC